MEGRLLFSPDPFITQKWYGFKAGHCILKGSFLNIVEKSTFLPSKPEEYCIPLELCSVRPISHPKKHLFEVVTSSGSKFNFITGSKHNLEKWIAKIKESSMLVSSSTSLQANYEIHSPILSHGSFLGRQKLHLSSKGVPKSQRPPMKSKMNKKPTLSDSLKLTGTFGSPLQHCRSSNIIKHVPNIVVVCTEIIEKRAQDHQGLYRVPGNTTQVNSLYHELMVSGEEAIQLDDERWKDINVVGSLLKLFFRKLPSPLITAELYSAAIEAIRKPSENEKLVALKEVLNHLPKHHLETFRHLAFHLHRVASNQAVNKMSAHNLSIVFGPTLICSREEKETSRMVADMSDQCLVVEIIITNVEFLFGTMKNIHNGYDSDPEATEATNQFDLSFSDEGIRPMKTDFDVILESNCESDDDGVCNELLNPTVSDSFLCVSSVKSNDELNNSNENHGRSYSCIDSPSSRDCSPFKMASTGVSLTSQGNGDVLLCKSFFVPHSDHHFQDNMEYDWMSECRIPKKEYLPNRVPCLSKTNEKDLTEQALQHLKKANFDLRAFKHTMEMEKLEKMQRTVSRERIEREYERTLGEIPVKCAP